MSLENLSQEARDELAALAQKLADNPETRKDFLRMTKKVNPDLPIPELEIEDKTTSYIEKLEAKLTAWRTHREENRIKVDEEDILHVVAKWTGIPLKRMGQDEMQRLLAVGLVAVEQLHRRDRHDGRDRMLVDELRMTVAAQKHREVVEPGDDALEFDAVHQKDRDGRLVLAQMVQEDVLNVLCLFAHVLGLLLGDRQLGSCP